MSQSRRCSIVMGCNGLLASDQSLFQSGPPITMSTAVFTPCGGMALAFIDLHCHAVKTLTKIIDTKHAIHFSNLNNGGWGGGAKGQTA
eukprot:1147622-Pelagomonas_calceolata.AAC.6